MKYKILPFPLYKQLKIALILSVSFPDVKGALPPTVTAGFVDAARTIW